MEEFKWTRAVRRSLGEIVLQCWVDAKFKRQFVKQPKKVLYEYGLKLPEDLTPKVVEIEGITLVKIKPTQTSKKPEHRMLLFFLPPPPSELSDNSPKGRTLRLKKDSVTRPAGHVVLGPINEGDVTVTPNKPKKPPK